ncbi:hypothetical protein L6452_32548 [Arctium lappa]|uniref:Uncharacterized protein n=1 Tax=Arctium lappa TaxID=4217 RepID=A0ACB8Z5S5_ARCLA|nr:hypothetical protein L6452_32548 [Arctium lappa]
MRSEIAEIKFTAESKLEEENALSSIFEEKSLEVEVKLCAADAKLVEVSRKASEIQRKSVEFDTKKKDLREWETKLQQGEERLADVHRLLNQTDERANENDRIFKQKQIELRETQMRIDSALSALKTKEDDMCNKIEKLTLKEKEVDAKKKQSTRWAREIVWFLERGCIILKSLERDYI